MTFHYAVLGAQTRQTYCTPTRLAHTFHQTRYTSTAHMFYQDILQAQSRINRSEVRLPLLKVKLTQLFRYSTGTV